VFKSISVPVTESSQVGEARRAARRLAEAAGFGENEIGTLNIIITEAGTNLHKYAKQGELIIRRLESGGRQGVEILSLDRGPGIRDVTRSLEDGFSTSGTQGQGLGAIKRLSSVFDIYSTEKGTAIVSQIWLGKRTESPAELETGAVCLPYPGETSCGDAWTKSSSAAMWSVAVADGLGHGTGAAEAAEQAVNLFDENPEVSLQVTMQRIHGALRATRGAALLLLQVHLRDRKITCAGVGNISACTVLGETSKSFVSLNGTVGHQAHRFQEFTYDWPQSALLIFHSDGLQTKWKLGSYPGLQVRHPALVAAVLYRDFRRERDDVTVLVVGNPFKGGAA
jgi:anti-sigma regulatory factor (Ser/Thr protein kinase)